MLHDHRFTDSQSLAQQLAEAIAKRLQATIEKRGRACLAVSGGRTPVLFFQALAKQPLPWSKVIITLVDERWVDENHAASNAALVREHLLQGAAQAAYFLPLKNAAQTPKSGFMECENRLHELIDQLDIAVLGLGNDGHTASWFPHSSALTAALDENAGAWCCPVLDEPESMPRMTLTWALLSRCQHLYLHFEGDDKNAVYDRACAVNERQDIAEMPVRTLLFQSPVPLSLYRSA